MTLMAQKNNTTKPGLKQEVIAVFGIFLSAFLFLSLVSQLVPHQGNWCGEIGFFIAKGLLGFTGWGAFLLPALLLLSALLSFRIRFSWHRLPQLTAGLTGAIISCCGLLASLVLVDSQFADTGGFLGKITFSVLAGGVGNIGTVLVLSLVFLVSLMLATRFSVYAFLLFCGVFGKWLSSILFSGMQKAVQPRQKNERLSQRAAPPPVREVAEPQVLVTAAVPEFKEFVPSTPTKSAADEFAAKPVARGDWKLPPLSLLTKGGQVTEFLDKEVYYKLSQQLEQKLKNFGVSGKVIGISPGPVVTTYEYAPAPGVKINKIAGLADDLALGLKAQSVRVIGSVPGKAALGIEIPNDQRQIVYIRDLLAADEYRQNSHKLTIALGLDVVGNLALANLAKMPHLLIAGATGAGKSVGINTIIASILYNATPAEVRFLMVDPKRIELSGYEGIPHLLHPVVVDPKLASRALNWAVREMERRYRVLEEARVKSFDSYNETAEEKLPYIVVIVDELADLMMVASKDVEAAIARLAQMARAAGIHMLLATQRPSVDVLTGLIKANFPTRISFKVSSKIDSRTILDASGAEHLLGAGDMLFLAPGTAALKRIHGAYISEKETAGIVTFWKNQGNTGYDETMMAEIEKENEKLSAEEEGDFDDRYDEGVEVVTEAGQASISMIQRRLRIGYNRAARMIETMEREGIVGPADGAKPREVIARRNYPS